MTERRTDALIEALAAQPRPVTPLAAPSSRAVKALAALAIAGAVSILLLSDLSRLRARAALGGGEMMFGLEQIAMLATAALAVAGAFHLSVPGRSRRWLLAPLPPLALWLLLSGLGCYETLIATGASGFAAGHGADCLLFILGASAAIGLPLLWRLSRAAPIDPTPVALLGGLGTAALSAFLLQFFHPFAVTFLDLAVHLIAILLVIALTALFKRPILRPA